MKRSVLVVFVALTGCVRFTGSNPESHWRQATRVGTTVQTLSFTESQTVHLNDLGFALTFAGIDEDTRCRAGERCPARMPYQEQRKVVIRLHRQALHNGDLSSTMHLYRYTDHATHHLFWVRNAAGQWRELGIQVLDVHPRVPSDGMGPSRVHIRIFHWEDRL